MCFCNIIRKPLIQSIRWKAKQLLMSTSFYLYLWSKVFWIHFEEFVSSLCNILSHSLYFWKLLLLNSSRASRVRTLWSALCILCVSVKQHLSVSEGCKRPVGSAQQGLPLDWLPMNLVEWVRLTSLSLTAIWGRECVNVWDQAPGTLFTSVLPCQT